MKSHIYDARAHKKPKIQKMVCHRYDNFEKTGYFLFASHIYHAITHKNTKQVFAIDMIMSRKQDVVVVRMLLFSFPTKAISFISHRQIHFDLSGI